MRRRNRTSNVTWNLFRVLVITMNIEQVEGQLSELDGKSVSVTIPIRGTVIQTFYGQLAVKNDWENHIIRYSLRFYPDADINFQAQDVHKIIPHPTENLDANIILKSDTWLEQEKYARS